MSKENIKILHLEDNPSDAELIKIELSQLDFNIDQRIVDNRSDFLRELERFGPDVVLLDQEVHGYSGAHALQEGKIITPTKPFILVTGTVGPQEAVKYIQQGAADLVLKENLIRLPAAIVRCLKDAKYFEAKGKTQEKYRLLSQELPIILWMADKEGLINYVNPEGLKFFGTDEEDLYGKNWYGLLHPDEREEITKRWNNALEKKTKYNSEQRMLNNKGTYTWIRVIASPSLDENGNVIGWMGTGLNIQKEKEASLKLEKSEKFTQNILSSLSAQIAVIDRDGNIISTNKAWKNFARENNANDIQKLDAGENYIEVCKRSASSGDHKAKRVLRGIKSILSGEKDLFSIEYPCHSPDEKRWYIARVVPFEGGTGAVIAHENITSRKLAEKNRKMLLRDLNERIKEQTFLYNASKYMHEEGDIPSTLQAIANDIPKSMQYPSITVGKITFDGVTYTSKNYCDPIHKIEMALSIENKEVGLLQVGYTKNLGKKGNDPFLREEYNLMKSSSEMVSSWLDKKITEKKLIDQKRFLDHILDNIPTDIAVFNSNHEYLYLSQNTVKDNELREWLVGKTDFDYCSLKNKDIEIAKMRRLNFNKAVKGKKEIEWIEKLEDKEGNTHYMLRRFYPIFEGNELSYVIGYGLDITQRRKGEIFQRESHIEQKLLADISQSLGKPISLKESMEQVLYKLTSFIKADHGEAWLTNIDYSKLQLVTEISVHAMGKDFISSTEKLRKSKTDLGLPRITWKRNEVIYWDNIAEKDFFLRRKEAKNIGYRSAVGIPIVFNEKVVGLFLFLSKRPASKLEKYDKLFNRIRIRLGAELTRKKSEKELDTFFNLSPDLMCISDMKGKLLKVNPSFEIVTEYNEKDLLSFNMGDYIHPKDLKNTEKQIEKLSQGKTIKYFENRVITKTGKIKWIAWTAKSEQESGLIYAAAKDISDNKKLTQQLLNKQRDLTKAIVKAQEEERQELGKELHDNINQLLAAAVIHLNTLKSKPEKPGKIVNKSIEYVKKAIHEARTLSHEMQLKENTTLKESIQYTLNSINPENDKEIEFIFAGIEEEDLSKELKINIYRITQEQLKNISQYANAKHIFISLTREKDLIKLIIRDDGIGFNPDDVDYGVGIKNIKNRTDLFNGQFKLFTSEGKGCEVNIEIPLNQPELINGLA